MARWAIILCLSASVAAAAPDTSLRPEARTIVVAEVQPSGAIAPAERDAAATAAAKRGDVTATSLRPKPRSRKVRRIARKLEKTRAKMKERGAICGDWEIQGEAIGRVGSKTRGCGVSEAVRVQVVAGVTLSQAAVMDCYTAAALRTWVEDVAKPMLADRGGGLKSLRVASHYICKTRNSQPGARISEHGRGRAIDISAFGLENGTEITVLKGWNAEGTREVVRKLHAGACGPFGTVLGPAADKFHVGHFHFDTARHRSGSYCR